MDGLTPYDAADSILKLFNGHVIFMTVKYENDLICRLKVSTDETAPRTQVFK